MIDLCLEMRDSGVGWDGVMQMGRWEFHVISLFTWSFCVGLQSSPFSMFLKYTYLISYFDPYKPQINQTI